jgi:hypothetical protein
MRITAPAEQSPTPLLVKQFCVNVDLEGRAIDYWSLCRDKNAMGEVGAIS